MYKVKVYDNFHHMDEDEAYELVDDFATEAEAVERAKSIVRESCEEHGYDMGQYVMFGEDPVVLAPAGAPPCSFSARDYAHEVCDRARDE